MAIVGARQVGKTTLARELGKRAAPPAYLDLENPEHEARLADPVLALKPLRPAPSGGEASFQTFLERDLPQLGVNISAPTLRRFWTMLAHYHGQVWNAPDFGRSFGVSDTTVRRYLDTLAAAMVVRQLLPWFENVAKRQVKSPKIYIADSGILHTLLGLSDLPDVEGHPKLGASWDGYVIDQLTRRLGARADECFFWATHAGAELDFLVVRGRRRFGFEVKRTSRPQLTPSMRSAMADLRLDRLDVLHAGEETFMLDRHARAVAMNRLLIDIAPLS